MQRDSSLGMSSRLIGFTLRYAVSCTKACESRRILQSSVTFPYSTCFAPLLKIFLSQDLRAGLRIIDSELDSFNERRSYEASYLIFKV